MKAALVLVVGVAAFFAPSSEAGPVNAVNEAEGIRFPEDILSGVPQTRHTDHLMRMKRAACDLFGFKSKWFTPGDSVCAGHCIALGNRGGHCVGSVCHCRK